jgi:protein-S-isoprenylcysteine O-methyltransferase Ste14
MSSLELKIPPPVVGLLVAGAMWWLSTLDRRDGLLHGVPTGWHLAAALMIAAIGAAFDVLGIIAFRRAKTTVNPMKPEKSAALVSSGVYRITRNPMYVGMAFILLAWAIFLASPWALFGPLVFAVYITRFQIKPEERALSTRFGAEFASYQARVRRWL